MLPTLNSQSSGDVVITERVTRNLHLLKRGDITIVRSPQDPTSCCCKRIAAMVSYFVSLFLNKYLIFCKLLLTLKAQFAPSSFVHICYCYDLHKVLISVNLLKISSQVPKGHVWLLGDNPDDSTDSRDYGPVPYGLIRGRVCFKVWPLSEFGRIE
ncbi:mitochondrial inner membrane protease subunit 1 [Exaiptasia diaphana]|uniref:Mitochondrial inner membrane protease subunit n=1 Tax=Exaiptasia diaphana TaxID=2652724 RepID=A0A913YBM8_EXADI|nr:mitochondrial inner membrane protease subunit 1 [Exaiptasia diaphana]